MHFSTLKSPSSLSLIVLSITHGVAAGKLQDRSVDLPVAEHIIPLRSVSSSQVSDSKKFLARREFDVSGHSANLRTIRDIFGIDVQVGDQVTTLEFDTGSPFTWVPAPGFQCVNSANGKVFKHNECPYTAYDTNKFSGGKIDGPILNASFGSQEAFAGPRGYEKVKLAGIQVDRQEIGIVDYVADQNWTTRPIGGDMGWSFPNTDTQEIKGNYSYTPWIFQAYEQGLVNPPVFSLALNPYYKDSADFADNGVLAIGGLPSDVKTTGSWAVTPVVSDFADGVIRYWTIIPDGFTVKSKENPQGKFVPWTEEAGYIRGLRRLQVATSVWGILLPQAYVDEIYKSIDPAPFYVKDEGWVAKCDASYSGASIRIGGVDLSLDRATVISSQKYGDDPKPGNCFVGVYSGSTLLGTNFLRNVLAVHDMTKGKERMLFKQRVLPNKV